MTNSSQESETPNADVRPQLIVSGGQTGVDRAALDAALNANLPIGGWCPRGRRSEDGLIPRHYPLRETAARSYAVRTEWNVRDADGTLIVVMTEVTRGTKLTLNHARRLNKPFLVVHLRPMVGGHLFIDPPARGEHVQQVRDWLVNHKIETLNVAGPRGSSHEEMYAEARQFLDELLLPSSVSVE